MDTVQKKTRMLEIEAAFGGRDIRDLIDWAFRETGTQYDAAARLGTDQATLCKWVRSDLRGRWEGRGVQRRLFFEGFALQRDQAEPATEAEPVLA